MRTITTLAAVASLIWGAPALAANGTLTYAGKTIPVQEISGGTIYANPGNGGTLLEQIMVEVDANGLTNLLPLVDTMIKGGKDMPNLTLTAEGQTHALLLVRLSSVVLPACTGQAIADPRIQVALHVETIKSAPELKSTGPVIPRPPVFVPLTSCTVAITGAPVTADTVILPVIISRYFEETGIGELRDYEKPEDTPVGGTITLNGKTLNAWARKDLELGTQGKAKVTVTYATASGPALVVTYPEARPDSASLVGAETTLMADTLTLTKP